MLSLALMFSIFLNILLIVYVSWVQKSYMKDDKKFKQIVQGYLLKNMNLKSSTKRGRK